MKRQHHQKIPSRKDPTHPVKQATFGRGLKSFMTAGIVAAGAILMLGAGPAKSQPPGAAPANPVGSAMAVTTESGTVFQPVEVIRDINPGVIMINEN